MNVILLVRHPRDGERGGKKESERGEREVECDVRKNIPLYSCSRVLSAALIQVVKGEGERVLNEAPLQPVLFCLECSSYKKTNELELLRKKYLFLAIPFTELEKN